jgi:hypothetical protein
VIGMARPRRPNEPTSYSKQPEIPAELAQRFTVVRAVLGEQMTISQAARELAMARVNMQALVHRVEAAVISALQPRPTGPEPTPAAQKQLQARVEELEKENAKLKRQLLAADDMMMAAGEIIRSLRGLPPTISKASSKRSKRSPPPPPSDDEDPEPPTEESILRAALTRMRRGPRDSVRAARALGVGVRTVLRWSARLLAGEPLIQRRGGAMKKGPAQSEARVREILVELHGMAGAASLAKSVHGVSRRRAELIKEEHATAMERARKQECSRVKLVEPGLLRAFDAVHLEHGFLLCAADGCVPYRTSLVHSVSYDGDAVARTLDADFREHGAPLVLRDDRASCHTTPAVLSVLQQHGVSLLQGPAYYPQYNGQHERQNVEHRHWLTAARVGDADIESSLERMKRALNETWRRPTLGWQTAAQVWSTRRSFDHERRSFLDEVEARAARIQERGGERSLAMRLAIEQALTRKGYLRITPGTKGAM